MKTALGALALILMAAPAMAQRQKDLCMGEVTAKLAPAKVSPGGKSVLTFTIPMKAGYHIYDAKVGNDVGLPTVFTPQAASGIKYGAPIFPKPKMYEGSRIHEGVVVIKVPVMVAKGAKGMVNVGGDLKVQACNATGCLPPFSLKLAAPLIIGGK
ncbi:MAG: protein-disulfide reductase DsbD family protein [Armatimonas sp.]